MSNFNRHLLLDTNQIVCSDELQLLEQYDGADIHIRENCDQAAVICDFEDDFEEDWEGYFVPSTIEDVASHVTSVDDKLYHVARHILGVDDLGDEPTINRLRDNYCDIWDERNKMFDFVLTNLKVAITHTKKRWFEKLQQ